MKLFVAKVTWYDGGGPKHDNVVIAAESFASASDQIATLFGESLETIALTLINPDRAFAFIDEITYNGFLEADI